MGSCKHHIAPCQLKGQPVYTKIHLGSHPANTGIHIRIHYSCNATIVTRLNFVKNNENIVLKTNAGEDDKLEINLTQPNFL